MVFLLEAETYEEERLATGINRAPTTNEQGPEPPTTIARPEEPAPTDLHIPTEPLTTVARPVEPAPTDLDIPPEPQTITPPAEQPDQPHAPEDILGILEEE